MMYLAIHMCGQVSIAMGLILSASCNNVQTGTSVAALVCFPMVLFGGFVATKD